MANNNKSNSNSSLALAFIILFIIFIICGCCGGFKACSSISSSSDSSTISNTTSQTTEPDPTPEPEPEPEPEPKEFIDVLKENMDETLAEHLNSILKDELGFSVLEFVEKKDLGDGNYTIKADGYDLDVTAMPEEETEEEGLLEEYIRIFTSDSVLYEDGEVKLSGEEFIKKQDHEKFVMGNSKKYSVIAQTIVEEHSKYKVKFYSMFSADYYEIYGEQDGVVCVAGNCEVQNAAGTYVKKKYIVQFIPTDLDNYQYEVTYVQLGNEEIGEAVKIETMYH